MEMITGKWKYSWKYNFQKELGVITFFFKKHIIYIFFSTFNAGAERQPHLIHLEKINIQIRLRQDCIFWFMIWCLCDTFLCLKGYIHRDMLLFSVLAVHWTFYMSPVSFQDLGCLMTAVLSFCWCCFTSCDVTSCYVCTINAEMCLVY